MSTVTGKQSTIKPKRQMSNVRIKSNKIFSIRNLDEVTPSYVNDKHETMNLTEY